MKYLIFTLKDEEFAIEIPRIVEILRPQKVFEMPELPDFLQGVINVRGIIIPVVDMRKRLGLPVSERAMIVVVNFGHDRLGLIVDEVKEIIEINDSEISSSPELLKNFRTGYLKAFAKKGDRVIMLLNLETLFTSEEVSSINRVSKNIEQGDSAFNESA
ncbi:MAG: chemotaxis protein CheW [Thermodesulfovibrionales bacterium]|nr:chemotaxis protein CheW [Thermodesulfovibrionales bacterium]